MAELFAPMGEKIKEGDAPGVEQLTKEALDSGHAPMDIIQNGFMPAMGEIGEQFRQGQAFVPEVLVGARAMQAGMAVLRPLLTEADRAGRGGTVVIGTVQGDIHDIGKNLVAMLLEGAGFRVVDLGVDISPQAFVEAVREQEVQLVALSALLTTTMPVFRDVMQALEDAGLRDRVKVMVGGAPVTPEYAKKVGADGFGEDAPTAVDEARRLLGSEG